MLAKRIVCNISGSFDSIEMSAKMKDNPDSGRIMDVFRGGPPCAPHRPRNFLQRVYSLASAVDSDCSRTAPGQCYDSTQQL